MLGIFEKIFQTRIKYKNLMKSFLNDPNIKLNTDLFFKKMNFKFNHTINSTLKKLYEK